MECLDLYHYTILIQISRSYSVVLYTEFISLGKGTRISGLLAGVRDRIRSIMLITRDDT